DAVIAAGIGRVVCAIEDPDPRVAGRGLARLRAAGIAVERGLMASEAHWMGIGHILRVTERRPFVQVKLALDADGNVPRGGAGAPVWVTSREARAQGQLLRARADAILVGRQTVIDDDPLLTCRLPGLEDRSPVRIIIARQSGGLAHSRLALSARQHALWLFCAESTPAAELESAGATIFRVPEVGGELWLPAVMETLVANGVTRLLVEGGARTWSSFSRAGLIDEAVLFQALITERALATLSRYLATETLQQSEHRSIGGDDMMVFRRHWRSLG